MIKPSRRHRSAPGSSKYADKEQKLLDQMGRQVRLAKDLGLRGVRWVFSNRAAQAHYETVFETHFSEEYGSGYIRIEYRPGTGM